LWKQVAVPPRTGIEAKRGQLDSLAHVCECNYPPQWTGFALGPEGPGMDARSHGCLAKIAGPLRRSAYAVSPPGVDASDWAAFRALPEAGRAALCSALSAADRDIGATPSYREVAIRIFAAADIHDVSPISSNMATRLDRMPDGRERAAAACASWASAVEAN
jgi:hypothetical protein